MDSPANFYDTDFFGTNDKLQKSNQVFLFESDPAADFSNNIGGLYENEDSIDFSQYIHNSGEQPNNSSNYDLLQFGLSALSTSPPKPHEFNLSTSPPKPLHGFDLPQLIKTIKPDPDGPYQHDDLATSVSDIDTAPCTPAFTDSNPGSPRTISDDITGEYMPQIGELQGGEALSPTGNFYNPGDNGNHHQQTYQQEPSETASEPGTGSAHSSPGGSRGKAPKRSRIRSSLDKESHEYKEKRERNNVAVRKSRMKSKEKNSGLQVRVDELTTENNRLNKRVELLTKELTVLKSLFTNVGKQPPSKLLGAISQ